MSLADKHTQKIGSTGIFNNAGNGVVLAHASESSFRVMSYPSLEVLESAPAHVGGVTALAMDPRGR